MNTQTITASRPRHQVITRHEVIEIDKSIAKTYIKLKKPGCTGEQILLNDLCVYIDIKRKGSCDVSVRYNAFDLAADGSVSFMWDDCFFCLPTGRYVGEIFADCGCGCACDCAHEKVGSVELVKRRTIGLIDQIRSESAAEQCSPACPPKECCDGAIPSSM